MRLKQLDQQMHTKFCKWLEAQVTNTALTTFNTANPRTQRYSKKKTENHSWLRAAMQNTCCSSILYKHVKYKTSHTTLSNSWSYPDHANVKFCTKYRWCSPQQCDKVVPNSQTWRFIRLPNRTERCLCSVIGLTSQTWLFSILIALGKHQSNTNKVLDSCTGRYHDW